MISLLVGVALGSSFLATIAITSKLVNDINKLSLWSKEKRKLRVGIFWLFLSSLMSGGMFASACLIILK